MHLGPVLGTQNDLVVIHGGRLISFDIAAGNIRWQVESQFSGQPSVANGRIYAVDDGRLRVLDEADHHELWSWTTPEGADLRGPMIVTNTHLFASTDDRVHAVDLQTHASVWSYPVEGSLAIADGLLYVAGSDGLLTAFGPPQAPTRFYTVQPCRVVDTRVGSGAPIGGPSLTAGTPRALPVRGHCGVPATARAVSVNITVVTPVTAGQLSLGPVSDPTMATVSYVPGRVRANNSVLGLGAGGQLMAIAVQSWGSTDVVIDVNGYFE